MLDSHRATAARSADSAGESAPAEPPAGEDGDAGIEATADDKAPAGAPPQPQMPLQVTGTTFPVLELRLTSIALNLTPLVVVPLSGAEAQASPEPASAPAPVAAPPATIATAVAAAAEAAPSTGDHDLDAAFAIADAAAGPGAVPVAVPVTAGDALFSDIAFPQLVVVPGAGGSLASELSATEEPPRTVQPAEIAPVSASNIEDIVLAQTSHSDEEVEPEPAAEPNGLVPPAAPDPPAIVNVRPAEPVNRPPRTGQDSVTLQVEEDLQALAEFLASVARASAPAPAQTSQLPPAAPGRSDAPLHGLEPPSPTPPASISVQPVPSMWEVVRSDRHRTLPSAQQEGSRRPMTPVELLLSQIQPEPQADTAGAAGMPTDLDAEIENELFGVEPKASVERPAPVVAQVPGSPAGPSAAATPAVPLSKPAPRGVTPPQAAEHPLAPLARMTDAERIALFT
jgi:hypothetical protein